MAVWDEIAISWQRFGRFRRKQVHEMRIWGEIGISWKIVRMAERDLEQFVLSLWHLTAFLTRRMGRGAEKVLEICVDRRNAYEKDLSSLSFVP